jgi:cytochrome c
MISRFAIAASLAVALVGCGSSNQPAAQSTETVTSTASAPEASPAQAGAAPSPAATGAPTDSDEHKGEDNDKDNDKGKKDADDQDDHPASPPVAFNQCAACHSTTPGKTIIGPSLAGVYGATAGQVPGFQFSDAMKNSGLVLNASGLDKFLADPKATVPGTIMALNGIKDASQRKAIIDYLKTLK